MSPCPEAHWGSPAPLCSGIAGLRLVPAVLQVSHWMIKLSTSAKPRTSLGKSKRRSSSQSPDTVCFYVLLRAFAGVLIMTAAILVLSKRQSCAATSAPLLPLWLTALMRA